MKQSKVHHPNDADELKNLFDEFSKNRKKIITCYSLNSLIEDIEVIVLDRLDLVSEVDELNSCITFQCGTKIKNICNKINSNKYTILPFSEFDLENTIGEILTEYPITNGYDFLNIKVLLPTGTFLELGTKVFSSVVGYNTKDIFLGTKNIIGIPVEYTIKLRPNTLDKSHYNLSKKPEKFSEEERRFLLSLKSIYDPVNLLNTTNL